MGADRCRLCRIRNTGRINSFSCVWNGLSKAAVLKRSEGKPLSDLYLFWNKLRSERGLKDVLIHDLRHARASVLVNSGHFLCEIQKMLGHADRASR